MNVVWHDRKRVKLITLEPVLAGFESVPDQGGYSRMCEEARATACTIQDPVDSDERPSCREPSGWKYAISRQAAMQTKRNEQWLPDYIPMRQTSGIPVHKTAVLNAYRSSLAFGKEPPRKTAAAKNG